MTRYQTFLIPKLASEGFLFDFIDGGIEFRDFPLDLLRKFQLEVEDLFSEKG